MVSAVTVFYRDVGIIIGHFMRLLFWISPILWSFMEVAGRGARLQQGLEGVERAFGLPEGVLFGPSRYNPISILLESYRKVVYGNLDHRSTSPTTGHRRRINETLSGPRPSCPTSRCWRSSSRTRRGLHRHRHARLQAARAGLRQGAVMTGETARASRGRARSRRPVDSRMDDRLDDDALAAIAEAENEAPDPDEFGLRVAVPDSATWPSAPRAWASATTSTSPRRPSCARPSPTCSTRGGATQGHFWALRGVDFDGPAR